MAGVTCVRGARVAASFLMAALVGAACAGCTSRQAQVVTGGGRSTVASQSVSAEGVRQAQSLLRKYRFHAVGSPAQDTLVVGPPSPFSQEMIEVSRSVGLDLAGHHSNRLSRLTYHLRERSNAGKIDAQFLYDAGQLVGAYVLLDGYKPPYAALDARKVTQYAIR